MVLSQRLPEGERNGSLADVTRWLPRLFLLSRVKGEGSRIAIYFEQLEKSGA